jgi:hypothetical protein
MSVVEDMVANRISDGWVTTVMPLRSGKLARDDGGPVAVAILEDLEQVSALVFFRRGEAPVVDRYPSMMFLVVAPEDVVRVPIAIEVGPSAVPQTWSLRNRLTGWWCT